MKAVIEAGIEDLVTICHAGNTSYSEGSQVGRLGGNAEQLLDGPVLLFFNRL